MTKKISITILLAVIFAAGIGIGYGFGKNQNTMPLTEQPIKVGVLADLSGDYVSFLRGIVRGAEIAVEDMREATGREIKLFVEDQKSCDPKETITAINKLIGVDKVDVVIGGSCSNTTLAAAPVVERSKTIMISPSSSASSVSNAGEYVFRTCPSDVLKSVWAAKTAYDLGKRKMAIIVGISNEANIEAVQGAKDEFIRLGGTITAEETVD